MRKFWQSTEYWSSLILVLFLIGFGFPRVHEQVLTIVISGVIDSYIMGRTLWKRNRGQFSSAIHSSEFHLLVLAHLWTFIAWRFHGLLAVQAAMVFSVNQATYNLCRGFTKGLAARPQVIMT